MKPGFSRMNGRGGDHGANMNNSGPLMTDHIRNLDLELEALKRKRELIEREHQLIELGSQLSRQRQHGFQQANQNFISPFVTNPPNYSNLYNPPLLPTPSAGNKRHTTGGWPSAPPKRKSSPQGRPSGSTARPGPKPFGQTTYSGPKPFGQVQRSAPRQNPVMHSRFKPQNRNPVPTHRNPPPLLDVRVKPNIIETFHKLNAKQTPSLRKDMKPKKKPAPPPAIKKIASLPVEQRKEVVTQAMGKEKDVPLVLHPDQIPTNQVAGRLELALGSIMKEIKEQYGSDEIYAVSFSTAHKVRVIKQAIRERLRDVMIGQVVGNVQDIIQRYRKTFPKSTDTDIVRIARDAHPGVHDKVNMVFLETDDPEEYFKVNMTRLTELKLKEMLDEVCKIYKERDLRMDLASFQKYVRPSKPSVQSADKPNVITDDRYDAIFNEYLERNLPELLQNLKPMIIKMLNVDKQYKSIRASIQVKANKLAKAQASTIGEQGRSNSIEELPTVNEQIDLTIDSPKKNKAPENVESKTPETTKGTTAPLPYFIKLIGRPTLPKRSDICDFLNQFQPASIKKHKTIQNLLVVGFKEKEAFEKILSANNSVIGEATIIIKPGERTNDKDENNESNKLDDSQQMNDTLNEATHSTAQPIITPDLEDQITDLLTSIRKCEEQRAGDNVNVDDKESENQETNEKPNHTEEQSTNDKPNNTEEQSESNTDQTEENGTYAENGQKEAEAADAALNPIIEVEDNDSQEVKECLQEKIAPNVKDSGRATPTRTSSRLANVTPSTIRTRRASRLAQNN